jgi:hypothetical protein
MIKDVNLLAYKYGFNIGDVSQIVKIYDVISPRCDNINHVYRENMQRADTSLIPFIVNGWIACDKEAAPIKADSFFAGIYLTGSRLSEYIEWCKRSRYAVGARDPVTHQLLQKNGVQSEIIGCATMTLPKYEGKRSGVYSVDFENGPGIQLSNEHRTIMTWKGNMVLARAMLNIYKTAELVYTSRLHVALPCLAFGTPVYIDPRPFQQDRYSILDWLDVKPRKIEVKNIEEKKRNYREFVNGILDFLENNK